MPVQLVAAVERQQVEVAFDYIYAKEMTRTVEVNAPIAESRCIVDGGKGQLDAFGILANGQTLAQSLDGTENAHSLRGLNRYTFFIYYNSIGLFLCRQAERQSYGSLFIGRCQLQPDACLLLHPLA